MLKTIVLLMLSTFAFSSGASGCHAKQTAALPTQRPNNETSINAMKVLAEGFHSSVTHPFIAVIRDAVTYAELVKLDNTLPKLDAEFFKSNAVIAAYLGTRNTGGFGVEIKWGAAGMSVGPTPAKPFIYIAEKASAKGVMVPQIITSPFKVVSLEVKATDNIMVAADNAWQQTMRCYRVTSGTFTMSGGFAGTVEQYAPAGYLWIMRERSFASFFFSLFNPHYTGKPRSLDDFTTGIVNADGHLIINKMSADTFVDTPNSGLKATATFAAGERKISLHFESLPSMIADGYQGEGNLQAEISTYGSKQ